MSGADIAIIVVGAFAFAAVCLGVAATVILKREHEVALVLRTRDEYYAKFSSQIGESLAKILPPIVSVAEALSSKVDDRVTRRVQVVNALLKGEAEPQRPAGPPASIDEAPPISISGTIDEAGREGRRFRRPGTESAREPGVGGEGVDMIPTPEEIERATREAVHI